MKLSKYTIESWFPTTVYISDNVCDHLLENLKKSAKEVLQKYPSSRDGYLNVDSSHLSTLFLFREYPFDELNEYILLHAHEYLKQLGILHVKLTTRNMWVNISNKGDYNFPHAHSGFVISGAFYVKANEGNQIIFYNDAYLQKNVLVSEKIHPLSYGTCHYDCLPGRLILFPSNFMHGNPIQNFEGEKIVVSFNLILDSEFLFQQDEEAYRNSHHKNHQKVTERL
jgi:uncharacterized protein (TIGR02466 family)